MPSKNVVNDDGKEENENADGDPALAKCDASVLTAAVVITPVEVDTGFSSPNRRRPKPRYSLHQSINGLPRCGVAIVVSDKGV
jgi:hypothetical protein